jgi:2-hydroxy-3-keto-5-methylthiopentenyl-1-phosphate phosphatase
VIYIGDGYTDLCPVQHADLVFATGRLAQECADRKRPFISFQTFFDIEHELEKLLESEQDLRR